MSPYEVCLNQEQMTILFGTNVFRLLYRMKDVMVMIRRNLLKGVILYRSVTSEVGWSKFQSTRGSLLRGISFRIWLPQPSNIPLSL